VASLVAGAVVYTWLYNNTRRSVLGAIVFHFAGNLTGEVIGLVPDLYAYSFVGTVLVAAVVTVRWGAGRSAAATGRFRDPTGATVADRRPEHAAADRARPTGG
jgi:hypothetical protein